MTVDPVLECVVCRLPEDRCSCSPETWRTEVAGILVRTSLRSFNEARDDREVRS